MKHKFDIINGVKMWHRECPQCKNIVYHKRRDVVYRKTELNRICRNCWIKNKTNVLEKNCPKCNSIIKYSQYKTFWKACKDTVSCRSCSKKGNVSRKGQKCSANHKLKLSLAHTGKTISEQAKYNMRLSAIKRMSENGILSCRNYNPTACKYFDKLNKEKGWNLQHAMNGGEIECCGYFLDGYDKNKNIIVEYDEPRHQRFTSSNSLLP